MIGNEYIDDVEKRLYIKETEIINFSGRPPCARIQASSCVIENIAQEQLLLIYGGRNDSIFAHT